MATWRLSWRLRDPRHTSGKMTTALAMLLSTTAPPASIGPICPMETKFAAEAAVDELETMPPAKLTA